VTENNLPTKLDGVDGFVLPGVRVNENRFIARVKVAQLLKLCEDPRRSEDPRQREGSTQLQAVHELRSKVQRLFEGAKRTNVPKYAEYIVLTFRGGDGLTPPITLFSPVALEVDVESHGLGYVRVPWNMPMIAIDGDTQLASRFLASSIDAGTMDQFIAVDVNHGRSVEWAQQAFHDMNLLAVRPNAALGIGMDQRDPLTHIARVVEQRVPFFAGRVNTVRRQLRPRDHEIVTITTLRGACVTLAEGISGVKWGAKAVPLPEDRVVAVERAAVEWWRAVTELLGTAIEDRDGSVAGAPAVLTAIGAVGNALTRMPDPTERAAELAKRINLLRSVDWRKGDHWVNAGAGTKTQRGDYVISGPKQAAHTVYKALTDQTGFAFGEIRHAAVVPVPS
jgi:DNA sulfur modification protein DndB